MEKFYPPWIGPDKWRVWILIVILVWAIIGCLVWIPVATCEANDDDGICAAPVDPPELPGLNTLGSSMWRTCTCNASFVIRNGTNARTLSNTVFANGDLPPTPEARGLSALAVSVLQFVLNDIAGPRWNNATFYEVPIPSPDPFFATPADISVPNWVVAYDWMNCPDPVMYTTPFIDLSNVYGVDPIRLATVLRAGRSGYMLTDLEHPNLLPYADVGAPFLLADARDGYTADVLALHTLLVLNHNSWADRVGSVHGGDWTDDQIFWKARQLNVAEWQHMLFHEWAPALLGTLAPPHDTTLTTYDNTLVQAVRLEVATVVVPAFVDTLTPAAYGNIPWGSQHGVTVAATLIQNAATVAGLLTDMVMTPALAFDDRVINARRNWYLNGNQPQDLVVDHVQRPRVLRVPDWAAIYTCFGTTPIAGDSRDAYQGFLEEAIYPGTSMGLTGAALLSGELGRLRNADPFFYTFKRKEIGKIFWPDVVRGGTMRGILLRNGGLSFADVGKGNVFFVPGSQ